MYIYPPPLEPPPLQDVTDRLAELLVVLNNLRMGTGHLKNQTYHSVQFSRSVMSASLHPHGLQHARLPCHHQLPEFTQTHVH